MSGRERTSTLLTGADFTIVIFPALQAVLDMSPGRHLYHYLHSVALPAAISADWKIRGVKKDYRQMIQQKFL